MSFLTLFLFWWLLFSLTAITEGLRWEEYFRFGLYVTIVVSLILCLRYFYFHLWLGYTT